MRNTKRSKADPSGCEACPAGTHSNAKTAGGLATCDQCPPNTLQWRTNQSTCLQCTAGLNCSDTSHLRVLPGFFVDGSTWESAFQPVPVPCPFPATCVGGIAETAQCANGSTGPLCGQCAPDYYRADGRCLQCPTSSDSLAGTIVLIVLGMVALLLAVFAYLRSTLRAPSLRTSSVKSTLRVCRIPLALARVPLRQAATIVKIVMSYAQMLFVFGVLTSVHWPPSFKSFIRDLNVSLVVGVEAWLGRIFLPLSCKAGELSAYTWLAMTLSVPPVCSAVIFALGAAARASATSRRKPGGAQSPAGVGESRPLAPSLYTLHIWIFLLLYPSLSRATLSTFVCTELGGVWYLNEDTREHCGNTTEPIELSEDGWAPSPTWQAWSALSLVGVFLYSIGLPLLALLLTRRWRRTAEPSARRRMGRCLDLLLSSYTEDCWWFESADLVRKLLLTSLILHVAPGSRVQLWFGLMVSMVATIGTVSFEAQTLTCA